MKSVTELLDAVPERVWEGIRFVATEDIPEPYRATFERNVSTTLRQWFFEFRLGLAPVSWAG